MGSRRSYLSLLFLAKKVGAKADDPFSLPRKKREQHESVKKGVGRGEGVVIQTPSFWGEGSSQCRCMERGLNKIEPLLWAKERGEEREVGIG